MLGELLNNEYININLYRFNLFAFFVLHINTLQAACDEDIENCKVEYNEKIENLKKILDAQRKKVEEEKSKQQSEYESKVEVYLYCYL